MKSKKYKNLIKLLSVITSFSCGANACFAHSKVVENKNSNNLKDIIVENGNVIGVSLAIGIPAIVIAAIIYHNANIPSSGFELLVPGVTDFLKNEESTDFLKNEESMKLYIKNELPKVTKILKKQNALATLDAKGDVMIIGDVHGTTEVIKYLIPETYNFLNSNKNNSVVILGDYIDTHGKPERDDSLAAALWFFNLIKLFPDRVRVLRGNHESARYGFYGSLKKYWCDNLENCMQELPIALTIFHNNKKYFAAHGCIDPKLEIKNNGKDSNLKKIPLISKYFFDGRGGIGEKLNAKEKAEKAAVKSIEFNLMWSRIRAHEKINKTNILALLFGVDDSQKLPPSSVRKFLDKFGYSAFIKGHDGDMQPVLDLGNKQYVITVHSITLVPGDENLHARVAYITNDGLKIKYFLDNNRTIEVKDF